MCLNSLLLQCLKFEKPTDVSSVHETSWSTWFAWKIERNRSILYYFDFFFYFQTWHRKLCVASHWLNTTWYLDLSKLFMRVFANRVGNWDPITSGHLICILIPDVNWCKSCPLVIRSPKTHVNTRYEQGHILFPSIPVQERFEMQLSSASRSALQGPTLADWQFALTGLSGLSISCVNQC